MGSGIFCTYLVYYSWLKGKQVLESSPFISPLRQVRIGAELFHPTQAVMSSCLYTQLGKLRTKNYRDGVCR